MKQKKYIIRIIKLSLVMVFMFVYSSCTKNFEEINTDPNGATQVPTSYLLTSAQQKLITINASLGYNKTMMLWSQFWSQRETTNRSLYDVSVDNDWSYFYSYGLPDLNSIIEFNSGKDKDYYAAFGNNNNQIAVAMILKAWTFSLITDTWGDVPYSQALNSDYNYPVYDKQSDIYPALIQELKDAAALINTNASGFTDGDLMFAGDMLKWKKFANSLRARLAMRMSNVDETRAKTEFLDAISGDIFTSNDDNALIYFQTSDTYANPIYLEFLTQNWTFPTEFLIERLKTLSDPRIGIYADPNNDSGEYIGLPYGLSDTKSLEWSVDILSKLGATIREPDFPNIFMSYSELLFLKAEAAARGWNSDDANTLYNEAITANMEFWGIDNTEISTYLSGSEVAYNSSNWLSLIGEQKWISFFSQGAQAFFEWRRLGVPNLQVPTSAPLNNKLTEMPRRYFYPVKEQSLNGEQLDAAITQMGGDLLTTRMWIDPK